MIGIMDDTVEWGGTPAATSKPQLSSLMLTAGRTSQPRKR
jgi:hypothetical protein